MSDSIVKTIDVARAYKKGRVNVPAVDGISLDIGKGQLACIVGPSGSGKSTLLNLVAGLDKPTRGRILLDDVDLASLKGNQLADYRLRKIGFIFQFYNLIPTLSAIENVEIPLSLAHVPKDQREPRAIDLLETVGLEDRIDHMPDELSGGEAQRVAIARALVNNPSVVLGDEPTGDLDSKSAVSFMELVKRLNKETGQTFIMATHDPLVVRECSKAFAIRDGKLEGELNGEEINEGSIIHHLGMTRETGS